MRRKRWLAIVVVILVAMAAQATRAPQAAEQTWPPKLEGAENGTVTLKSELFLQVPESVKELSKKDGATPFVMAEEPPTVDLAYHGPLPNPALNGTGWSSWGDIGVAEDGSVYSGIGDHGNAAGGESYCFIYRWDPDRKVLEEVVDMREVLPENPDQPTWSKVHARIDEGPDGKIYFSCTLNDGNRAHEKRFHWTEEVPGGQVYQYDPETGETKIFANLPPKRCTATALLDKKHNVWWCNLESPPDKQALWALDLDTGKPLFKAPDGSMGHNRNFALANDGTVYFNGEGGRIMKADAQKKTVEPTNSVFPGGSTGMRSSTRQTSDGYIYGNTMRTNKIFRYHPGRDELKILGTNFLTGGYTTVTVLSPDEKYLYYLPGAHGGAYKQGTPLVQYEIASGQRKVIAFLRPAFEAKYDYIPGGTYGIKLSKDGSTLYVNLNGHAGESNRLEGMRTHGFGLTSFAAVHIPASER